MIKVTFYTCDGNYTSITSKGHAEYSEYGTDIVCSAISSITQSLALGILKVLKIDAKYNIDEKDGYLELRLPEIKDEKVLDNAQVLFKTAYISLKDFQKGYPSNIKVNLNKHHSLLTSTLIFDGYPFSKSLRAKYAVLNKTCTLSKTLSSLISGNLNSK